MAIIAEVIIIILALVAGLIGVFPLVYSIRDNYPCLPPISHLLASSLWGIMLWTPMCDLMMNSYGIPLECTLAWVAVQAIVCSVALAGALGEILPGDGR
jgi:hypothetical protein